MAPDDGATSEPRPGPPPPSTGDPGPSSPPPTTDDPDTTPPPPGTAEDQDAPPDAPAPLPSDDPPPGDDLPTAEPAPPQLPDSASSPRPPAADASPPQPPGVEQRDGEQPDPAPVTPTRDTRTYSPTERFGLCYLAIRDGARPTARAYGLPFETLETWLRSFGGLAQLRGWLSEMAQSDLLRAERAIFEAVARRADGLSTRELLRTFRRLAEMYHAPVLAEGVPAGAGGAGAGAAAQATARVTVRLVGDTGEEDIIVVDRGGRDDGKT